MNFLIIGQAPNSANLVNEPLEGKAGQQLAGLFGCSYQAYRARTQRFNLLPGWLGKQEKGDKFPFALAKQNAMRMRYSFQGCAVLFVGVGVARAFDVGPPYCQWRWIGVSEEVTYVGAILPHVSGINLWWNSKTNTKKATDFMRRTWGIMQTHQMQDVMTPAFTDAAACWVGPTGSSDGINRKDL